MSSPGAVAGRGLEDRAHGEGLPGAGAVRVRSGPSRRAVMRTSPPASFVTLAFHTRALDNRNEENIPAAGRGGTSLAPRGWTCR